MHTLDDATGGLKISIFVLRLRLRDVTCIAPGSNIMHALRTSNRELDVGHFVNPSKITIQRSLL